VNSAVVLIENCVPQCCAMRIDGNKRFPVGAETERLWTMCQALCSFPAGSAHGIPELLGIHFCERGTRKMRCVAGTVLCQDFSTGVKRDSFASTRSDINCKQTHISQPVQISQVDLEHVVYKNVATETLTSRSRGPASNRRAFPGLIETRFTPAKSSGTSNKMIKKRTETLDLAGSQR
jgi:hypothetical protein